MASYWINTAYTTGNTNLAAPGTQNAIRTSLNRLWLKPLVHVDPDIIYFRARKMQMSPAQRALLQLQVNRQLAVVALVQALGGGWQAPWQPPA